MLESLGHSNSVLRSLVDLDSLIVLKSLGH